jgi:hypothetical protein
MAIQNIKGTVQQAYPSKIGSNGNATPHNFVLDNGKKMSAWTNKISLTDEEVRDMVGNTYIFTTSDSSEYNGVETYKVEIIEPVNGQPITQQPVVTQDGNGGEVEGSSSPVPEPKQLNTGDAIIRQVAFKEAMNLYITSGITVETFLLDEFNFHVNNLFAVAKGTYLPPEPIDVIDYEEEQKELFPEQATDQPF